MPKQSATTPSTADFIGAIITVIVFAIMIGLDVTTTTPAPDTHPQLPPELEALVEQTIERARTRGLLTADNRLVTEYDEAVYRTWKDQCFGGHPKLGHCIDETFSFDHGQLDQALRSCIRKIGARSVDK